VSNELDREQHAHDQSTSIEAWEREQRLLQSGDAGISKSTKLIWFIIGLATGAVLVTAGIGIIAYNFFLPNEVYDIDNNRDGKADQWYRYKFGVTKSMKADRNFDGKVDEIYIYKKGRVKMIEWDRDYKGTIDATGHLEHGLLKTVEFRPNGSKVVIKKQIYKHGILKEDFIDKDRDGKFDEHRIFDIMEEPINTIPIR
jgi:hypothetical protein